MPNFNPATLNKGGEAIRETIESSSNGDFKPFLSQIFWGDDKDESYILILNPLAEIPRVKFHGFINIDGQKFPEQAMARTDASIGEALDPIENTWKYEPKETNIMIAVELDVTYEQRGTRQKPVGFNVKTREFQRTIRDDDGEPTDEKEDVVAPMVGYIAQSPFNFTNSLESIDASDGPIETMAFKVTRLGKKSNVSYQFKSYEDVAIDLTDLIDYIGNVSYVDDDMTMDTDMSDQEAAEAIGQYLLFKKLNELADPERYEEIFNRITEPSRYQKDKKEEKTSSSRAARPSQRNRTVESDVNNADEPEVEVTPEPKVTKASTPRERVKHLQEQQKGRK